MNIYEGLANSMAFENNIDIGVAAQIVGWLDTECVLDYDQLKEVYLEEGETITEQLANDNTPADLFLVVDNV
jgi:hypothetical protein